MRSQDEKIRHMLSELGRSLIQAMSRSAAVNAVVQRIRDEGYSLYLVLAGRDDRGPEVRVDLGPRRHADTHGAGASSPQPAFLLNSEDVQFLHSIGIDPTRSPRRRRGSS